MTSIPARIHNAQRAFNRLIVTRDMQQAMAGSGRLLSRYLDDLPDGSGALHARARITELADQYLKKCERYKAGRKAA